MKNLLRERVALVALPFAGVFSAFLTAVWPQRLLGHEDFLGGMAFGTATGVCCCLLLPLRSTWKIVILIVVSAGSAFLAFVAAGLAHEYVIRNGESSDLEMFAGGFVGGFILLSAVQLLFSSERRLARVLVASVLGALVGGALGVVGSNSGALFTHLQRRLAPHEPNSDISLIFIWQTGMAVVFAVTLWVKKEGSGADR